jgi:hypothetical protein
MLRSNEIQSSGFVVEAPTPPVTHAREELVKFSRAEITGRSSIRCQGHSSTFPSGRYANLSRQRFLAPPGSMFHPMIFR